MEKKSLNLSMCRWTDHQGNTLNPPDDLQLIENEWQKDSTPHSSPLLSDSVYLSLYLHKAPVTYGKP